MVASVQSAKAKSQPKSTGDAAISENRVLVVLMRRLHTSKSFGENLIFMLNRAGELACHICVAISSPTDLNAQMTRQRIRLSNYSF